MQIIQLLINIVADAQIIHQQFFCKIFFQAIDKYDTFAKIELALVGVEC